MSFRWPELLWAVLLVPLVLLVWVRGERRRTQRAGVFGNPALLPNVVTARPGWRRVLPVILYLWPRPCSCCPGPPEANRPGSARPGPIMLGAYFLVDLTYTIDADPLEAAEEAPTPS